MNREEFASKTAGYTYISLEKIITVIPNDSLPYNLKYEHMAELLKYPKLEVKMPQGDANKRITQLSKLGYNIIEVLWQGEKKHQPTQILFSL